MGDASSPPIPTTNKAWVTLLTRTSYLPGAILLAHSLHKNNSKYPLIVLTTPSFPASLLPTVQRELSLSNAFTVRIRPLLPPHDNTPETLIAARFADTWTKLSVFELYQYGLERGVFLDADMLVRRNMDELFELPLPDKNWIAANHACVCNLDHDSWAPEDWKQDNCAYTGLNWKSDPTAVPLKGEGRRTHTLLNSGLFIFTPHQSQWEAINRFLKSDPRVKSYMFPDQDFLADFFEGKWFSIGWQYNALKTMRYWHASLWRDNEVRNIHYIVDKPWSRRIGSDGVAGYLGRDGKTHEWWWQQFAEWQDERQAGGETKVLEMMRKDVAKPLIDGEAQENLHGNWTAKA